MNLNPVRKNFTLVEIIVSMGVFTVLMFILINITSATQKVWLGTSGRTNLFVDARMAMDLINRDLQGILYNDSSEPGRGIYPFYHQADDKINFISETAVGDSSDTSNIREVRYARGDGELKVNDDAESAIALVREGWLARANTADKLSAADEYNFAAIPKSASDPNRAYRIWRRLASGVSSTGGNGFQEIIPNVVSLKFTCYNRDEEDMRDWNGDGVQGTVAGTDCDYVYSSLDTASATPCPYAVGVDLTLLDENSWNKWKSLVGSASWTNVVKNPDANESAGSLSRNFRERNQRTFSNLILIGDRLSY